MKNATEQKPSISISELLNKPSEEMAVNPVQEQGGSDSQGQDGSNTEAGSGQDSGSSEQGAGQDSGSSKQGSGASAGASKQASKESKEEVKLARNMLTPSNWDIREYDKKQGLIQAIGGGHNLICTRKEFSSILFKGHYTK